MIRFGVVTNPGSRRNKSNHAVLAALAKRPEVPCFAYRGGDNLAPALAEMATQGVTDLIVDGGDGTVVATISAALEVPAFTAPPRLAIVPSGTTNLIASEMGMKVPRESVVDRLLGAGEAELDAATIARSPMRIERGDGLPVLHGFLLGAAAFHRGTLLSWERVHPLGATQRTAVGLGILANIWNAIFGADRRAFLDGDPMRVEVDGEALPGDHRFLFLLSTLDRLVLGLRPFWGDGPGPIRWLDVTAPPRSLIWAAPRAMLGRPKPWMRDAGYRSGKAAGLLIHTRQPVVVDGEIVEPGPSGTLQVRAERPIRFIRMD
jgi:hypothetical protein